MRAQSLIPLFVAFPLFLACGDKDDDTGGTTDGGSEDGGASDGGTSDGGTSDGGTSDGGTSDGGADGGADGGGDGGTTEVDEYAVLGDYLVANSMDLPDVMVSWVVSAQSVFEAGLDEYFIVDIRTDDKYEVGVVDFEEGHLTGAHGVALADVVDYVAANNTENKPVLVYCYTGTAAGHAVMALRLAGHEAVSLQWGMSGWHSDFDLWTGALGNAALDYDDAWEYTAAPTLPMYDVVPTIETGLTEGADILMAQIDARILSGLNKATIPDVLSSPESYQIINYWAVEDWDHYGHITGAWQVAPNTITVETLSMLDPATPIVVYCWSGQTASMVAAWLQVMGYEAHTLVYSANGLIYDNLESHTFTGAMDYNYVTGP